MPLQATSGAASYDAFGGGVAAVPNYIEDVFSTWLYTGNGSSQTINNGIDLAGEGGLVWNQSRSNTYGGYIYDTARGTNRRIQPFNTAGQLTTTQDVTAFNSNGFTMGSEIGINGGSGQTYVSWTFRKQPKFFDVVTYTGNGVAGRTVAHNLGSAPGCIIVKRTDTSADWQVYHRSNANTQYMVLNSTAAVATGATRWNSTTPTDTVFSLGTDATVNASGGTYVAYLFAHDAGGFGLTGTDNVISCGSFTTDGSGAATVSLGYEPQWLLVKAIASSQWLMLDNMRGWSNGSGDNYLFANTSGAENPLGSGPLEFGNPTATGFDYLGGGASTSYIYIAIRRGPMKVPTTGTSVFVPIIASGGTTMSVGFPADMAISGFRDGGSSIAQINESRLTQRYLATSSTASEGGKLYQWDRQNNLLQDGTGGDFINWNFRRAPGFFDVVCYQGSGVAGRAINHNLGVAPELMIVKSRSSSSANWVVGATSIGVNNNVILDATSAATNFGATFFFNTAPTSSVFYVGSDFRVNVSIQTYVAYLFASAPGVSKVFSYTGNGSSQTINCGFTGGARFVMVKRTDSTGNWMVVDTARGLVSAGDPTLYLNSTAAEVTGVDWIDPDNSGFIVNQEGTMNANVSSATYIGLAIA